MKQGAFQVTYDSEAPRVATLTTNDNNKQYVLNRRPVADGAQFSSSAARFWTDGRKVVVEGTAEPDDVLSVARLLAEASEREPSIHAVVLASVRTDPVDAAPIIRREHEACVRDDVDRWLELLDVFDGVGVELLDWFVLGHEDAASLRALTGLPARRSPGRGGHGEPGP